MFRFFLTFFHGTKAEGCSLTVGGIMGPAGPAGGAEHYASAHSILRHMSDNTLQMWAAGGRLGPHTDDAHAITSPVFVKKTRPADLQGDALKAQDFQVNVAKNYIWIIATHVLIRIYSTMRVVVCCS